MHPSAEDSARTPPGECVVISPDMVSLIGCGPPAAISLPSEPVAVSFTLSENGAAPALRVDISPCIKALSAAVTLRFQVTFVIGRAALVGIGGRALLESNSARFHLPTELRAIVLALREPPVGAEARTVYRGAKSLELLCEAIRLFVARQLVPISSDCDLQLADSRRLLAARQMIDERWNEKLTLDAIARACGLNRAKLTRGFREMFDCTIAEALATRRLLEASRLLLTTDLPVSSVGYESGYLNNAAFSRAFGRHFGRSPSHYRAYGMAA
jgi:AraC family transcriptional activator of pyochelin receptor